MAEKERGYKVIRRQKGKADTVISFANTSSLNHMLEACATDGYKKLSHETTQTPKDPDFISTTVMIVEPLE